MLRFCFVGLAVILLSSAPALAQNDGIDRIKGVIAAPEGYDLNGALIYTCDLSYGLDCPSHEHIREYTFNDEHGEMIAFSLIGLERKAPGYGITAWKDMNQNGVTDVGDLVGAYFVEGDTLTPVTVPAEKVFIRLIEAGQGKAPPSPMYVTPGKEPSSPAQTTTSSPAASTLKNVEQQSPVHTPTTPSPSNRGPLSGAWKASGEFTDVEYGPEVVTSNFGLPKSQRLGTIGNGGLGTYDYGMRYSYKPYKVSRTGRLDLRSDGTMSWSSKTASTRSSNCTKTTEFSMSGTWTGDTGARLVFHISQGQQTVSYNRECTSDAPKTENLSGQTRAYETKLENGVLKIRQVEPVSSTSSFWEYRR